MTENEVMKMERELRSLSPRRPSRGIEARLFSGGEAPAAGPASPGRKVSAGIQWLVPGMAAALTLLIFVGQRGSVEVHPIHANDSLAAMVLSNQSVAASVCSTSIQMHNTLAGDTFEWTNGSASISSIYFVSPRKGSNN